MTAALVVILVKKKEWDRCVMSGRCVMNGWVGRVLIYVSWRIYICA
jgi:hypothetical protein